jgi:hypothetical protein
MVKAVDKAMEKPSTAEDAQRATDERVRQNPRSFHCFQALWAGLLVNLGIGIRDLVVWSDIARLKSWMESGTF